MEGLSKKLSLQSLDLSQSERSSKKYRFQHDVKRRIKERLERKRAKTYAVIHENVQSKILCSNTDTEDEAMSENYYMTSKCSHLATIIKRIWAVNSVGSNKTSEKMYSPGHTPCYLRRNLKGVNKKKRLGHKTTTPKRKKSCKVTPQWGKKQLKTSINTDEFYFRFRTSHSIHTDSRCNNTDTDLQYAHFLLPKTVEIGISESGQCLDSVQEQVTGTQEVFKTCSVEDSAAKRWHRAPLFPKRPRQWKSLVRENDDGPD